MQWVKLAESLRLSDLQRLRAAVLWDIINTARRSVLQQRAHLANALSQVMQADAGPPSPTPTAAAPAPGMPIPSATPPAAAGSDAGGGAQVHAGSPSPHARVSSAPRPAATSGSSTSGRPGAAAGGEHQHHSSSEALSGGGVAGALGRTQSGSSQVRLEGQVRARLAQSPAALQQEAALLEKLHWNTIKERCARQK